MCDLKNLLRRARVGVSAGAFISLGAGCASGPQVQPSLVPAPLVNAVFDDRLVSTSAAPVYSVGAVPTSYPARLVPGAPARVIGGMTTRDQVIVVFADSSRRLAADVDDLLRRSGFTRPAPPRTSGFSSAYAPTNNILCSDSASASVEQLTGANRNLARVTYRPFRAGYSCPVAPPAFVSSPEQLVIPALTPPPGVRVGSSGGGSGGDNVHESADVTGSDLVPSTILAHYAAQLTAAGWRGKPPAMGDGIAAQYFEATTPGGSVWSGVLMAVGGGKTLSLSLNMKLKSYR